MYYDLIIIHLVSAYARGLKYKHHKKMIINKIYFNEYKQDT